jgi:hypothetical protein
VDKRRIGLSMIESARRAREAAEAAEKNEERAALTSRTSEGKSLGTLADLLAASKQRPKR